MTDGNTVVIERTFDAPVALVWQLWTEAEHFAAWYGPAGASIPVADMDVRVGGTRRVRMEVDTPSGPMQMEFTGEYLEVVEHERLVYTESVSGSPGDAHRVTTVRVELEDAGGRTRVVMTHVGISPDSPGASGWAMAFDKLDAHLTAQSS